MSFNCESGRGYGCDISETMSGTASVLVSAAVSANENGCASVIVSVGECKCTSLGTSLSAAADIRIVIGMATRIISNGSVGERAYGGAVANISWGGNVGIIVGVSAGVSVDVIAVVSASVIASLSVDMIVNMNVGVHGVRMQV